MIDRVETELEIVERHLTLLRMVLEDGPIGFVSLSTETGYPRHKVRYSLRILEEEESIISTKQGAVTTGSAGEFKENIAGEIDGVIGKIEDMRDKGEISV